MNSLVVFLSVVALAVAKPSGSLLAPSVVAYSAPIIAAAPAAVSHQSRLDIKSSPAVVATAAVAPVARTVIAEPTLLAAPAVATAAIAPAAVSSQSRIDIKTTPAVTSTVVSAAPVTYSAPAVAYNAALTYNAPIAYSAPISYSAPILTSAVAPTIVKTAIAGPVVPLETPEVAAARAAHLVAKAQVLADAHLIHKRSAPFIAAPVVSTYSAAPLVSTYHTAPLAYSAPVALTTSLLTKAYSVHPW